MNILFGFFLIILGAFSIAKPEKMWYLKEGWQFRNAEPSDAALLYIVFGGITGIILGFIVMFMN